MGNIRQFRAFDAIVRLGSFAEAARAIHVTPAALSLSIRELEQQLGFAVLERTTRSVGLSEAGRGYLPFVRRVLADMEEADRYAGEVQQGHGVVRIAATPAIIATLLAAALPEVHRIWPNIRFHLLDVPAANVPDTIASRQADLAISQHFGPETAREAQIIFTSHWDAFIAASHKLGQRKQLKWRELAGHRLFMNKSSELNLRLALGSDAPFDDVHEVTTAISGLTMASSGAGIGIYPSYVRPFASISGVIRIPLGTPRIPHHLLIVAARDPSTTAPLLEIRDALIRAVQSQPYSLKQI